MPVTPLAVDSVLVTPLAVFPESGTDLDPAVRQQCGVEAGDGVAVALLILLRVGGLGRVLRLVAVRVLSHTLRDRRRTGMLGIGRCERRAA